MDLDISSVRGSGAVGKFGIWGGSMDFVRTPKEFYLRGDRTFWRHFLGSTTMADRFAFAMLANRWVKVPVSVPAFRQLVRLTNLTQFFSGSSPTDGALVNEGVTTFRGQKVIALRPASHEATVYVSASGTPYPVAVVAPKAGDEFDFGGWNQPISTRAPNNALPVPDIGG
jgi:hypothetical protein